MLQEANHILDNLRDIIEIAKQLGDQTLLKELLKDVPIIDSHGLECYAQRIKDKAEKVNRRDLADQLYFLGFVY